MLGLEYQIILAFLLDLVLGDPPRLPHPVRAIGRFALFLEDPCRRIFRDERIAGIATVVAVLFVTWLTAALAVSVAGKFHPLLGDVVSILILYTTLAARDLAKHSTDVYDSLAAGNLPEARRRASLMVGRDTDRLDEGEVSRAAIESVAESTSDGVTAPLFFAFLGGPVGALLYKAVNTLDSSFGYKNDLYRNFGWASARLDDLANYLPSRITAVLIPVSAYFLNLRASDAFRILRRDASKHPSPNSGQTEAAFAGALGIRLGGTNVYFGKPSQRPTLGDPIKPIDREDIRKANALMVVTAFLGLLAGLFFSFTLGRLHV